MGNTLLDTKQKSQSMKGFEAWLEQYGSLTGRQELFENKFFKTYRVQLQTQSTFLIIKVYLREKEVQEDLKIYLKQLQQIRDRLPTKYYSNLLPYSKFVGFDLIHSSFIAICRQAMSSSLKDHFITPPSLSESEKHYILMQVIVALYSIHSKGLYHGCIRSSNVLLTTFNHVYLSDFASFKPQYLSIERLSQYSLFYAREEQFCYLAPEKFQDQPPQHVNADFDSFPDGLMQKLQRMDLFSLGCLIYETYTDGKSLFNYEQILQYKKGQFSPQAAIDALPVQVEIRQLITNLTQLVPEVRDSAQQILQQWFTHVVNKKIYCFLYYLDAALLANVFSQADIRIALIKHLTPSIYRLIVLQRADSIQQAASPSEGEDQQHPSNNNNNSTDEGQQKLKICLRFALPQVIQNFLVAEKMRYVLDQIRPQLTEILEIEGVQLQFTDQNQCEEKSNSNASQLGSVRGNASPYSLAAASAVQQPVICNYDFVSNLQEKSFREYLLKFEEHRRSERLRRSLDNFVRESLQAHLDTPRSLSSLQEAQSPPPSVARALSGSKAQQQQRDSTTTTTVLTKAITLTVPQQEALKVIVRLICCNFRSVSYAATKCVAIELLGFYSQFLTDTDNLLLIFPYLCDLFRETEKSTVLCAAFDTFADILARMQNPFQSYNDTQLFELFVWENIKSFSYFGQRPAQRTFATRIAQVTSACQRLVQHAYDIRVQLAKQSKRGDGGDESQEILLQQAEAYREANKKNIAIFVVDYIQKTLTERKYLEKIEIVISRMAALCDSMQASSHMQILMLLVSCLNEHDLRLACLQNLPQIAATVHKDHITTNLIRHSVERCLYANSPLQVFYAISLFRHMVSINFFDNQDDLKLLKQIAPLVLYPHNWIRGEAVEFMRLVVQKHAKDQHELLEIVAPYLTQRVQIIDRDILDLTLQKKVDKKSFSMRNPQTDQIDEQEKKSIKLLQENYLNRSKAQTPQQGGQAYGGNIGNGIGLGNGGLGAGNGGGGGSMQLIGLNGDRARDPNEKRYLLYDTSRFRPLRHSLPARNNQLLRSAFAYQITGDPQRHQTSSQENVFHHLALLGSSLQFRNQLMQQQNTYSSQTSAPATYQFNNGGLSNSSPTNSPEHQIQKQNSLSTIESQQREQQQAFEVSATDFFRDRSINVYRDIDVSIHRQRLLQTLQNILFFQTDKWDRLSKIVHHQNFLQFLLAINSQLHKFNQFQVKEELEIGRASGSLTSAQAASIGSGASATSSSHTPKNYKPSGQLITTIYEHTDSVAALHVLKDQRHFLSASDDGRILLFDLQQLEVDWSLDSIASINCQPERGEVHQQKVRIRTLKSIEGSTSIVYGTDKENIHLCRIEMMDSGDVQSAYSSSTQWSERQRRCSPLQRYKVDGEVRAVETFESEFNDKCFMYATLRGEIGVKDIRSKSSALKYNVGRERGLISSLLLRNTAGQQSAIIGTLNSYILVYDIRCNILSKVFELRSHRSEALPVLSLSNFYSYAKIDTLDAEQHKNLLGVSYASDSNEVAFFDITSRNNQCVLYLASTPRHEEVYTLPQLSMTQETNVAQGGQQTLKDQLQYDFVPSYTQKFDIIQYLKHPLVKIHNGLKQQWLDQSKNCQQNIQNIFKRSNQAYKVVCLPSQAHEAYSPVQTKNLENSVFTAGSDRNIRYFPFTSDQPKEQSVHKYVRGLQICNVDDKDRGYQQIKAGGSTHIIHEFYKDSLLKTSLESDYKEIPPSHIKMDRRSHHNDAILDMAVMERPNSHVIITASRDKTIKVWK